ncbi:MAG: hypothetical protein H6698_02285 [Myxococcales bacterium]|nr:hypothetical protein [Myxococcales bacterium]MCB9519952.1 hypothetical protein [Myxococcales bacterium]MCB9533140.1 hypothetical protein [Myxococcales bacterium]
MATTLIRTNSRTRAALVALAALPTFGFFSCPPKDDDPCEIDAFGCRDPSGELPSATCEDMSPLTVEVGWGERAFTGFETPLEIHYGLQGGQHGFFAIRVTNAALDRYDQLRLTISTVAPLSVDECAAIVDTARRVDPAGMPDDLREGTPDLSPAEPMYFAYGDGIDGFPTFGPSRCVSRYDSRSVILGSDEALTLGDDGAVEVIGVFLQVPYEDGMFVAEVEDPCGRTGLAAEAW